MNRSIAQKHYSAGLSANNVSFRDTPNTISSQSSKTYPSQSTHIAFQNNNSNFSFQQQIGMKHPTMYQGKLVLQEDMSDNSDWDSEPELEIVQIQEASRIPRKMPSIRSKRLANDNVQLQPKSTANSVYCCEEIGPRLDLGYQWPQKPFHQQTNIDNQTKGFMKISISNTHIRQNQVDRFMLAKRNKNTRNTPLLLSTVYLKDIYAQYNSKFTYDQSKIPKRVLTKPSKPIRNESCDNENFDYILKVNEILGEDPNHQYRVIDLLGQGTFGQVVKCERVSTGELCSVKVIKNKSAYKTQSCMEIEILKKLNTIMDPEDKHHILRLHYVFSHKNHLCLVFELLSYNLYDFIGHNRYRGFPPEKVRAFAVQILDTLCLLKEAKIIHCDLKPENILLTSERSMTIKVIDFGSSCHEANRIYTYIQSRFYRSPEVLLGMRYTGAIDMWSFGCIVAELFLGLPIFPGSSEYNQLFRIVEMLGVPSKDMLSKGRNTHLFFNKKPVNEHNFEYELKSREQYSQENNKNELPRKKYFPQTKLKDIVLMFNQGRPILPKDEEKKRAALYADNQTYYAKHEDELKQELEARLCLLDFLYGVLELNPLKRWTPQQALQHPFITQKPFTGPFVPDEYIESKATSSSFNSDDKIPSAFNRARRRAESMGKPTAPEQIQMLAEQIQHTSPISKYKAEPISAQEPVSDAYRQRNTRSQGDYVGLVAPHPEAKKNQPEQQKKVKIAPQIKLRRGSHDSVRIPPHDGQTVRSVIDGKTTKLSHARKVHAGEAAGGLLMMRQLDKAPSTSSVSNTTTAATSTKRNIMTDAFRRRK
ncbi:Serine/threonine-protein kinase ppk15 [Choanephora cucurbitarum]|uniref:Serine/threonine-protein kinase ppk15 n=1 Tax=Choanephora cucurbitarum TaxID=101091 RepID=A0A1C7NGZ4_9FUNG|nr:Serine/threonine-protein kinase ppk15 [Choanephora cucurbitarum]